MHAKKILFIHHSTGGNLIREGHVRDEIQKRDVSIEFWDHNYNLSPVLPAFLARFTHLRGLTDNHGHTTGKDYAITLSNNSPREYAEIFSRDPTDPTLRAILSYDVVAFKNCYPTTRITSEAQLNEDIRYFLQIRDAVQRYSHIRFVLLTPPPARKSTTNLHNANRAKKLAAYLLSPDFIHKSSNVHVFDLFGLLADDKGFLRHEYERHLPWDSHPNTLANMTIAPIFASFLINEIQLSSSNIL